MAASKNLTPEQISEAMRLLEDGMSYRKVAMQFGVHVNTIQYHKSRHLGIKSVVRTMTPVVRTMGSDIENEGVQQPYNSEPKQKTPPPPPKHKPNEIKSRLIPHEVRRSLELGYSVAEIAGWSHGRYTEAEVQAAAGDQTPAAKTQAEQDAEDVKFLEQQS